MHPTEPDATAVFEFAFGLTTLKLFEYERKFAAVKKLVNVF
jgi:hypothetical protein